MTANQAYETLRNHYGRSSREMETITYLWTYGRFAEVIARAEKLPARLTLCA